MSRWQRLESWIDEKELENSTFMHAHYAHDRELAGWLATGDIQDYLRAQPSGRTRFILHRVAGTRTSNAVWHVGVRTTDTRAAGLALHSDVERAVYRRTMPTIQAIATKNPRAARTVEAQAKAIPHALAILEIAVQGIEGEE